MKLLGIIGNPLGHSFSKQYFTEKFVREGIEGWTYEKFPLGNISELPGLIASHPDLCGLNVTIPYKQQVIPYLDALDDEARQIGAVNCISFRNGRLTGHNTDAHGFRSSLLELIGNDRPAALVLGTGGAAKAVHYVLKGLGIDFIPVSRTKSEDVLNYDELDESIIYRSKLIINTTLLGTHPEVDALPDIPYRYLTPGHYLFDLVYNPAETAFMKRGREHGASICNGYGMLVGQAEAAWEIWWAKSGTRQ